MRPQLGFLTGVFPFFGSLAGKLPGEFYDAGKIYTATVPEPLGVVGGIISFNWPPSHGGGKDRSGAGGRQHRRAQARRAGPADRHPHRRPAKPSRRPTSCTLCPAQARSPRPAAVLSSC